MSRPRVAVVSGASRGLGASIAHGLAADGWSAAVNYAHGRDQAESVVDKIRADGGVAEAFGADVVDERGAGDLFREVGRVLGPVTAVIANATGSQPEVSLERLTWRSS